MEGVELKSSLGFYEIPATARNIQAPPPKPNGGLFTGQQATVGAGWAAIPVTPESHIHLAPALAPTHIPGGNRAGNNVTHFPSHGMYNPATHAHIQCSSLSGGAPVEPIPMDPRFLNVATW